jgi:hypothetical protein
MGNSVYIHEKEPLDGIINDKKNKAPPQPKKKLTENRQFVYIVIN